MWLLLPKLGQHNGSETAALTLRLGAHTVRVTALRDTGNSLRDPVGRGRVLVADAGVLRRLLPQTPLTGEQLADPAAAMELLRLLRPEIRPRLLPYRAVGVESALLLAVPCICTEEKRKRTHSVLVAFSPTPVSDGGLYDALM